MLRYFLLMVGMMAASTGAAAGDVVPCPGNTVPIEISIPGVGDSVSSIERMPSSLPHFRAFVTAVTEHVAARLDRDKLCINDNLNTSHSQWERSLLQFVYWPLNIHLDFNVPVLQDMGGQPVDCRISSPWIDLVVMRRPTPRVRGIFRWNERQLLADQAVLDGGRSNVPPSVAMPLKPSELDFFMDEYDRSENPAAKPIEERVPPDILWLFRRSLVPGRTSILPHSMRVYNSMRKATEKGAEGYTKLVIALVDRCFASSASGRANFHYTNILNAADLIPLEQYRIDMPIIRRGR
jgi:hypothetical protein